MQIWEKLGYKTDLEYFKRSYAGKEGEAKKYILPKLGLNHPFYAIKRPVDPLYGHKRYEFKIYDLYHNGFIEKEVLVEGGDEPIPTLDEWFNRQKKRTAHFREYITYCIDSCQY